MNERLRSDWDKLFARCATDGAYRQRLAAALPGSDEEVGRVLADAGVDVSDKATLHNRAQALRELRGPMTSAADAFGDDLRMAP